MKCGSLSKHANIDWEFVADVDDKLISNRYGAGVGTSEGLAAVFRDVAARVSRPSSLSHACPARARPRNIAHSRFYPLPYFLQKIIRIFIDIFLYNNNHCKLLKPTKYAEITAHATHGQDSRFGSKVFGYLQNNIR